jgi:hypothetical protein
MQRGELDRQLLEQVLAMAHKDFHWYLKSLLQEPVVHHKEIALKDRREVAARAAIVLRS